MKTRQHSEIRGKHEIQTLQRIAFSRLSAQLRLRGERLIAVTLVFLFAVATFAAEMPAPLTPAPSLKPKINGPGVFGVRPGSDFLYTIPASGQRPMRFSAEGLPRGLKLDAATGRITGSVKGRGEYSVLFRAGNELGSAQKQFRIVVGDRIALTPPMGWNSWNCWAEAVSQEKVLRSARAIVGSGLVNHGWTYVNIDDSWQGQRGGSLNAIQANEKFPDMKGLCDEIHRLGLKAGIYSTPFITSYALFVGGSSEASDGAWSKEFASRNYWRIGKYDFAENDATQWAQWGFDYLKLDWRPNDVPHTEAMARALRKTRRDIVLSLSNTAPIENASDWARLANCWRTTGDIIDIWKDDPRPNHCGVSEIAFSQDRWAPYAGPGHWNDPDMLVLGQVGWGPALHPTRLTPDEQYSHFSMWCLLSAPLLLGCDLEKLDAFTLAMLTNDEVLALDQDALGKQAMRVASVGTVDVFFKELEDGSRALGFFNRAQEPDSFTFSKLRSIGLPGTYHVRDLWRQQDLADAKDSLPVSVPAHGVVLLKLTDVQ